MTLAAYPTTLQPVSEIARRSFEKLHPTPLKNQ